MVAMSETTKKVLLFIGAALCLFLVIVLTVQIFKSNSDDITPAQINETKKDVIKENQTAEEQEKITKENKIYAAGIKPEFIQKNSMRISLTEVYMNEGNEGEFDIFFHVKGEDTIVDEEQSKKVGNFFFRSPFSWNGDILFHAKELTSLLVCDYSNDGRFFEVTFCIGAESLDQGYFGQKTRFAITDKSFADLQEVAPIALSQQERTFVFDVVLPKEFYEQ